MLKTLEELGKSFKLDKRFFYVAGIDLMVIGLITLISLAGGKIIEKFSVNLELSSVTSLETAYTLAHTYLQLIILIVILYLAISLIIFTAGQQYVNRVILKKKTEIKQFWQMFAVNVLIWGVGIGLTVFFLNSIKEKYLFTSVFILLLVLAYISINGFYAIGETKEGKLAWKKWAKSTFHYRTVLAYLFSAIIFIAIIRLGMIIPAKTGYKILWLIIIIAFLSWVRFYLYKIIKITTTKIK